MRITKALEKQATRDLEKGGGWISGGSFVIRETCVNDKNKFASLSTLQESMISTIQSTIDHVMRRDIVALEGTPHLYEFGKKIIRRCGENTWVNKVVWDSFAAFYAWQEAALGPVLMTQTPKKPILTEDVIGVIMPMRSPVAENEMRELFSSL